MWKNCGYLTSWSSVVVVPAQVGGLTLQKQYKYGKVLLWKYTKPMQQEGEAR